MRQRIRYVCTLVKVTVPCQGILPPPSGQIRRGSRRQRLNDRDRHPLSLCVTIRNRPIVTVVNMS